MTWMLDTAPSGCFISGTNGGYRLLERRRAASERVSCCTALRSIASLADEPRKNGRGAQTSRHP